MVTSTAYKRPAYPAYKPSDVEWLGEIPEGWEKLRLKHIASINDEVLSEATAPDYELLYVDIGNVEAIYGIQKKEQMRFENAPSRARRRVRDGDVIISTVRTYLRAIVPVVEPESNLVVSTGFAVVRPRQRLENIFAAYVLRAPYFVDTVVSRSVGVSYPAVNASDIVDIHLVVPPSSEQRAIAAFLDRETARVDALVEKKQRQVELLQEKRTALISCAVTKGLDSNARMKDSGIEWLGEIPAHWNVVRVKALERNSSSVVQTGPFGAQLHAGDYVDEGVPLILIRNIGNMRINDKNIPRVSLEDAERLSMYRLKKGDIVFSRVGSIGRVAPCTEREDGWLISGQILRLRITNPHLKDRFAAYAFGCSSLLTFVELQSVGSTRESINTDILRNMPLPIPPSIEQHAIAAFLDRETARIDALIERVEASIDLLSEYRTALISAAVIGKIDVRKEAA